MANNCQWRWIPGALAVGCVVFLGLELIAHDQLVTPVTPPPRPFVPPPAQRYVAPVEVEIPAPPVLPAAPLVTPASPRLPSR